jgi:hypothetical protein
MSYKDPDYRYYELIGKIDRLAERLDALAKRVDDMECECVV